jgi:Ribose/xylose/arabinose/galactoside ABC-type transport systems, permease components
MVNGQINTASNQRLTKSRLLSMFSRVAVLVIMMAVMAILSPSFFTVSNLLNILRQAAPIFIIGAGQTIVILARGIDLSMDSVASLTGVIMATIMVDNQVPFYIAMPLGLLMGMCMGFVNGFHHYKDQASCPLLRRLVPIFYSKD